MPQSRKPDPTLRAAAEVSPPSPPAPTIVGRPTLEAARRIGESVIVAAITSAGLYLVGSVYTDAYYGRLSIETTSLDLAPPYVALQSVHVLQALLEYPSILLLLFVLYQTFARPARRLRLQIERTRQRFPRLLLVLANLIVVAPLLVSAFFHTYQGRAMAERSLLAPVASGLERASLILLAYAIWLGWNQRAFIVSQIRARQLVPIALVFSVYLLTTLLATAGTATVAAEALLTGTSEASLGVVFTMPAGAADPLAGKDLILVSARHGTFYVVEQQPDPPSLRPTAYMIPAATVEVVTVRQLTDARAAAGDSAGNGSPRFP